MMRVKSYKAFVFLGSIVFACFAYTLYKERTSPFQEMPTTLTNFEAMATNGIKTSFNSEKGAVTLVVLSASWCPACMAEIPTLKALHQDFSKSGFKILMVSEDDNLKAAARFKKAQQMPWTVVHWNYDLMNALGNPRVIPVAYLIDTQGSIARIEAGILDKDKMRSAISSLL